MNELLRMRRNQLIDARRERRDELNAQVQSLEQQVRHYELAVAGQAAVSPVFSNEPWTNSPLLTSQFNRVPGSKDNLIERLVEQNEQIMALLLPRREDAHVLDARKVTRTETSGQSLRSLVASRDPSSDQKPNDEKSDTATQQGNKTKEPTKKAVLTVQSPTATLSWLPDFEWTDEDELALNKFENDADVLDIPDSGVNNPLMSNTDTTIMPKDQKAHHRFENRKNLETLLSASLKSAGRGALKRPRWRLDAEADNDGVSNFVEDAEAMAPLQVFRSAVLAVLHTIYLKNMLMEKKLAEKASATTDFESMLRVFFDATRLWLGKVVKTPLLSLFQDSTLDVDISTRRSLAGSSLRGFAKKFGGILARRPLLRNDPSSESSVDPTKLLKLKVRMKGILQALGKAIDKKEVPSGMLDFWKRISTDGVYFPPSYQLFLEERRSLEFNALGATRRMEFNGYVQADMKENERNDEPAPQEIKCFSRFNIVMPWSVGIGPKNSGKQTSANLTALAIATANGAFRSFISRKATFKSAGTSFIKYK
ncbi:hypothetical protein DVH05_012096 [Phytophthora capsici]|nr:hypothetical protein DVH05_012096 [Phytophthora capsici]